MSVSDLCYRDSSLPSETLNYSSLVCFNMLHWLPVEQHIEFKILLYTYKVVNSMAPAYLQELLDFYTPGSIALDQEICNF